MSIAKIKEGFAEYLRMAYQAGYSEGLAGYRGWEHYTINNPPSPP